MPLYLIMQKSFLRLFLVNFTIVGLLFFNPKATAAQATSVCKAFISHDGELVEIYVKDQHIKSLGIDRSKAEKSGLLSSLIQDSVRTITGTIFGSMPMFNQIHLGIALAEFREAGICHGVYVKSSEKNQTEPGAEFLAYDEPKELSTVPLPPGFPPKMVELRDSGNALIGGISELIPGKSVYITNKHVLAGQSYTDLEKSFKNAGLNIHEMSCIRFFRQGVSILEEKQLDAVLVMPKRSDAISFETLDEGLMHGCGFEAPDAVSLRLRIHTNGQALPVKVGDSYASYQYSAIGGEEVKSLSSGTIAAQTFNGKFFLPTSDFLLQNNSTTFRGSGSIVFTRNRDGEWRIGGIIECRVPAQSKNQLLIPGAVRVIPLEQILSATAIKTNCDAPEILAPVAADKDCVPIDARGGGGD